MNTSPAAVVTVQRASSDDHDAETTRWDDAFLAARGAFPVEAERTTAGAFALQKAGRHWFEDLGIGPLQLYGRTLVHLSHSYWRLPAPQP